MSLLEDLIGQPLHEISDEELDEIIMKGRLAREGESTKAKKPKVPKDDSLPDIDLDDFE